jgi:predicted nicotinamide N-methyase
MTTTRTTREDLEWREYDIQEQDSDEDAAAGFSFFQSQHDELQLQDFEFTVSPSTPTLKLTFQEHYTQSTGMSIWRGSEVLAEYLKQNPEIVHKKSVLEIGAGVGLVGLTAHHLGASRVLWTDGDEKVLANLRKNVQRNTTSSTSCSTNGTTSTEEGNTDSATSSEGISCCPQLIWGKNLEQFREEYGCSQVILGTDLFYMTKSLAPLFETVHELMMTPDDVVDDEGGCFVAVMTCSAQSPKSTVLDVATRYGFQWTTTPFSSSSSCLPLDRADSFVHPEEEEDDDDMDDIDRIYIFRRRRGCRRNDLLTV